MQSTISPNFLLKKHFGFEQFRPLQENIIDDVLNQKDVLVLMPTGGGKSICYQLPAIMLSNLTIVVSPLIALMKDQVGALRANGISAAVLNSSLDEATQNEVIEELKAEKIKLLYLSPEKLLGLIPYFQQYTKVSLFAIDEAHCISQWGHDFRPEYTKLSLIRESFPNTPIIALTATADKITRKDIATQLLMRNPNFYTASFDRPNLSLEVRFGVKKNKKMQEIASFIHSRNGESGIIYCLSRKSTEEISASLAESGISCAFYHAGMSNEDRSLVQDQFINDQVQVICATIAFGMGIDKSNVRFVIHVNLPKNLEGYYQEIGRAGRDGLPGKTILYYGLGDVITLRKFIEESGQKDLNLEKLNRMQQYAESPVCRRKVLLAYFGETLEQPCNNCDVCKNPSYTFEGTEICQKALSALVRTKEKVGINLLIDILRGSNRKEILEQNFQTLKTFGVGKDINFHHWQNYLVQMLNIGLIEIAYDENFWLKTTDYGKEVLFGQKKIQLVKPTDGTSQQNSIGNRVAETEMADPTKELFDYLRGIRRRFAEKENVPAYVVFSDATLMALAETKPVNVSELLEISGMGEFKVKKYGPTFVKEIKKWLNENTDSNIPKTDTYSETLHLLNKGLEITEIAELRGLNEVTIYSHLAHLYTKDLLENIEPYFNQQDLQLVKNAVQTTGEKRVLGPLFNHLNGEIPYHTIRLCLAYLAKTQTLEIKNPNSN